MTEHKAKFLEVCGLDIAGLEPPNGESVGSVDKLVFLREEAIDQWKFLEQAKIKKEKKGWRIGRVQGPPGTGKSTFGWAWARSKAYTSEEEVLWAHLEKGKASVVVRLCGNEAIPLGELEDQPFVDVIHKFKGTFIVLDGIGLETPDSILKAARKTLTGRRVVELTSQGLVDTLQATHTSETEVHVALSWSFEQYSAAMSDKKFRDNVGWKGQTWAVDLEEKFFYAGGCARWMFGFSVDQVIKDIEAGLEKRSCKEELLSGLGAKTGRESVNRLLQLCDADQGCVFVSQFLARRLATMFELSFVTQAALHSPHNPSFQGWILEMKFICLVRQAHKNNTRVAVKCGKKTETWKVVKLIDFKNPEDLTGLLIEENTCFLPLRWNQGAYDLAFLVQRKGKWCARFVQVTLGESHTFKGRFATALKNVLQVTENDVVFMGPPGWEKKFKIGQLDGGIKKGDCRVMTFSN
jgi:hypothetical protein